MRTLLLIGVWLLCGIGSAKAADPPPPPAVISFAGDVKSCDLPDCISFDGDIKPLPWHLKAVVAGKPVEW